MNGGGFARGGVFSSTGRHRLRNCNWFNFGNGKPKGPTGAGLVEGPNHVLLEPPSSVEATQRDASSRSVSTDAQRRCPRINVVADGAANPAGNTAASSMDRVAPPAAGGTNAAGTVFRVAPDGTKFSRILSPPGEITVSKNLVPAWSKQGDFHQLLGTTRIGGSPNQGGVFSVPKTGATCFRSMSSLTALTMWEHVHAAHSSDSRRCLLRRTTRLVVEPRIKEQSSRFVADPDHQSHPTLTDIIEPD